MFRDAELKYVRNLGESLNIQGLKKKLTRKKESMFGSYLYLDTS